MTKTYTKIKINDSLFSIIGVVLGQILFFICLWFIGRYMGAGELGDLNLKLSFGMFLGTIFVFRYELACISNSPDESFNSLCNIYLLAGILFIFFCLISFLFINNWIEVTFFSLSFIVIQGFINYLNSLRKYLYIGFIRVIINLLFLIALIVMAAIKNNINLFFVYTSLYFFIALLLYSLIWIKKVKTKINLNLIGFLNRNRRYPLFILPSTCCSAIYLYSLSIMIPFFYGMENAGYFTVAYKMGFFPIALISQSISGVFRRDMLSAVENSGRDARRVYRTYMKYALFFAVLYFVLGYLLSEWLIEFLFGRSWDVSAIIYKSMLPLFCIQLIYSPASQLFLVFQKQKIDFIMNSIMGLSLATLFLLNYFNELSMINLINIFSIVSSVILIFSLYVTYKMVQSYDRLYN